MIKFKNVLTENSYILKFKNQFEDDIFKNILNFRNTVDSIKNKIFFKRWSTYSQFP